ncbi:MAG TPA: NADH-quinone oxidoreductase subunit C, partial [bacterium]|nr:NADH-quinone oxidoreductase subunit C [bacterium]
MADLHNQLKERFPGAVVETHAHRGDETAVVKRESLLEIALFIQTDPAFQMNVLMDSAGVDGLGMNWKPRFEVVYHFYSMPLNHRLRIKVRVEEKDPVVP